MSVVISSLSFSLLTLFLFRLSIFLILSSLHYEIDAFQSFTFPKFNFDIANSGNVKGIIGKDKRKQALELEKELLSAIQEENSSSDNEKSTRLVSNSVRIQELIESLEDLGDSFGNIQEPAISPEIYGRWRLIYSTNKDTSSPIQRTAIGNSKFPIYQDIVVNDKDKLQVNQVIQFGEDIYLSVDAIASTSAYPIPDFTERTTTGKVFGLNVLGVSYVGEEAVRETKTQDRPNTRIDFVFDEGNLYIGNKLKIPYPVPFRLPILRDWVKGWLSISYLSTSGIRISRGNKGTTFILVKEKS